MTAAANRQDHEAAFSHVKQGASGLFDECDRRVKYSMRGILCPAAMRANPKGTGVVTSKRKTMENIENAVRQVVARVTGLVHDLPADADLYLDLSVASVHAVQILTGLEEGFGITIPDDDFVEATSVTKLTNMIANLVGSSPRT
jgi:acyl carrier protein